MISKTMSMCVTILILVSASPCDAQAPADWTKHPANPLITSIPWGTGIDSPCVIFWQGQYHMWYWANHNTDWAQIGHATSADGLTWTDDGVPAVSHNHAWGEDALGWPSVVAEGDSLKMWYSTHYSSTWSEWRICYAVSVDGANWTRYQDPVFSRPNQSLSATVIGLSSGSYRMYFQGYSTGNCGNFEIAESADGIDWTVVSYDHIISNHTWTYHGRPSAIVRDGGVWHMWYTGRQDSLYCRSDHAPYCSIGYAQSLNGLDWYELYTQPALTSGDPGAWDEITVVAPCVLFDGVSWRMYYNTASPSYYAVGLATSDALDEILPVELISYDAIPGDGQISLMWETASETDNDHFEVIRDDAQVGHVAASGNSTGGSYQWIDRNLDNGTTYDYTVFSVDVGGIHEEIFSISATPSADGAMITEYALHQNYPNPFNPTTNIRYSIPEDGHIDLSVFEVSGRQVRTLVSCRCAAGTHNVHFNAAGLSSGIYIYRLTTPTTVESRKMVLMK